MNALDVFRDRSWNPFAELTGLQRRINRVFDETLWPSSAQESLAEFCPACDVSENDNAYLLAFDLPGVPKESVKIEMKGNVLSIYGERKEEKKQETKHRSVYERHFGQFQRSFTLPDSTDRERVNAEYENGVLRITVPKSAEAKPRQIPIQEASAHKGTRAA